MALAVDKTAMKMTPVAWPLSLGAVDPMGGACLDGIAGGLPRAVVTQQAQLDQHYSFARLVGTQEPQSYATQLMSQGVAPCFVSSGEEGEEETASLTAAFLAEVEPQGYHVSCEWSAGYLDSVEIVCPPVGLIERVVGSAQAEFLTDVTLIRTDGEALTALSHHPRARQLASLTLGEESDFDDFAEHLVDAAVRFPCLRSLCVDARCYGLSTLFFRNFAQATPHLSGLRSLRILAKSFYDKGDDPDDDFDLNDHVKANKDYDYIAEQLKHVAHMASYLQHLTRLELRVCELDDCGPSSFDVLQYIPALAPLFRDLKEGRSSIHAVRYLAAMAPHLKELKSLEFSVEEGYTGVLSALTQVVPQLSGLTHLDVRGSDIRDEEMSTFRELAASLPQLQSLDLSMNGLSDDSLTHLQQAAASLQQLKKLSLWTLPFPIGTPIGNWNKINRDSVQALWPDVELDIPDLDD